MKKTIISNLENKTEVLKKDQLKYLKGGYGDGNGLGNDPALRP